MDNLQSAFEVAAREAQELPTKPDNNTLLRIYALYKQATKGDATGSRPPMFDLTERMKFDAWARLKGTTHEKAMHDYIALIAQLKQAGKS